MPHVHGVNDDGAGYGVKGENQTGPAVIGVGAPPKETPEISTSVDPIGSFNSVFAVQMTEGDGSSISENYVWSAIAEPVRDAWGDCLVFKE
jgi:hypothetical protein